MSPEQIRLWGLGAILFAIGYWVILRLLKPEPEVGMPAPSLEATSHNATYAQGSHIITGNLGSTFYLAPKEAEKPITNLEMHARLFPFSYLDGVEQAGIRWRTGYAHVQLHIVNSSDSGYANVSVLIQLDFPIAVASATSTFTDVRIGADGSPPQSFVIADIGDGECRIVTSEGPASENQDLASHYRLFCANMPAHSEIAVSLAVAQEAPFDEPGDIFLPVPPKPTVIVLRGEYTAYGEQRSEAKQIGL